MKKLSQKDISFKTFLLAVFILTALRLILAANQMIYILPRSAPIDDDLYFDAARNITNGLWLGEYGPLTLTKYPLFAVYLACLHRLKIPYMLGNAILWIAVAALAVWAFAPLCKKNIHRLALYFALTYSPACWAGFNMRVYRDAIFPALCTLFFVMRAGRALRLKSEDIKGYTLALTGRGLGLGLSWICREDGYWLLPFGLAALITCIIYIIIYKDIPRRRAKAVLLAVPGIITGLIIFAICITNYKYYNLFKLDDFNSGSFASAYGAMTRIPGENWDALVAVPADVRYQLYENCPSFRQFEFYLEDETSQLRKAFYNPDTADYRSGSLYWAIRRSAGELGIYESRASADRFFTQLAAEVNAYRDTVPGALKERHSITPPIKSDYIIPTINQVGDEIARVLSYRGLDKAGYPYLSDSFTGLIDDWQDYLHNKSNYSAIVDTAIPYHTPLQDMVYLPRDTLVVWLFRILTTPLLLRGIFMRAKAAFKFKKYSFEKQILIIVLPGLLAMALFRLFIAAFMEVAAFGIGTSAMYLGTVWPPVLLVALLWPCLINTDR